MTVSLIGVGALSISKARTVFKGRRLASRSLLKLGPLFAFFGDCSPTLSRGHRDSCQVLFLLESLGFSSPL